MFLLTSGLFISYFYNILVLPQTEGSAPTINPTIYPLLYKGMVIIPYNNTHAIHLHHWILYLLICLISIFFYIPEIFIGFSIGLLIQGITYKDSFNLICRNPYN